MSGDLKPLFTWRSALCDSGLPPTTRHVLLTLSLHMNERGGSCWPSVDTLVSETGLGRSSVIAHISSARKLGWLGVEKSVGRVSNRYTATIPQVNRPTVEPSTSRTVQEPDRPAVEAQPSSSRTSTVQQPDPSTSVTHQGNSPTFVDDGFAAFWTAYPARNGKKVEKAKAIGGWKRIPEKRRSDVMAAVVEYAAACNAEKTIAKDAFRWLAKAWEDWLPSTEPVAQVDTQRTRIKDGKRYVFHNGTGWMLDSRQPEPEDYEL